MSNNGKVSDIKAALDTTKEDATDNIYTLSTGVRVKLSYVSGMLIQNAMNQIKDPPVPIIKDEQQGREYENPNDPIYLEKKVQANLDRGYARLNTIILWGIELVDGMPNDDTWLPKLQLMEKHGLADLSDFDFDNPLDKEFAYKKFIAIGDKLDEDGSNHDMTIIIRRGTVDEEAVEQASDSFQGDAERGIDQDSALETSKVVSE